MKVNVVTELIVTVVCESSIQVHIVESVSARVRWQVSQVFLA